MMKIKFEILMVLLLTGLQFCYAGDPDKKERRFRAGESLKYSLHYGFINGGEATINLHKSTYNKEIVFHSKAFAKTVGLTDKLFKIRDRYESYFDMETCLPYKSIRDIKEGGYTKYEEVIFNHNDSVLYDHKGEVHKIPTDILDVLSLLYFIRSYNMDSLKNGDVIDIITFFDNEIFPFDLRYKGVETVKVDGKKYRCHRFDPVVEPGRIFKSDDDMQVWITADKNLVPMRVRFDLIVGSVKCDLVAYSNLKFDLEEVD